MVSSCCRFAVAQVPIRLQDLNYKLLVCMWHSRGSGVEVSVGGSIIKLLTTTADHPRLKHGRSDQADDDNISFAD